jgi:hypothetical protein
VDVPNSNCNSNCNGTGWRLPSELGGGISGIRTYLIFKEQNVVPRTFLGYLCAQYRKAYFFQLLKISQGIVTHCIKMDLYRGGMILQDIAADVGVKHIAHQSSSFSSGGASTRSARKSAGTFDGPAKKSSHPIGFGRRITASPCFSRRSPTSSSSTCGWEIRYKNMQLNLVILRLPFLLASAILLFK